MPIEIKKYTCQFKCGIKPNDFKGMDLHEQLRCAKNPEHKTCQTCKNEIYERDSDGEGDSWRMRDCKLIAMSKMLENIQSSLLIQSSATGHLKPIWNCPNHNQDIEVEGTADFVKQNEEMFLKTNEPLAEPFF